MHANFTKLTDHFLIKRILRSLRKGVRPDARLPVTQKILSQLIAATSHVCSNSYEASLFATLFSVAFYSLCRVSELTASPITPGSSEYITSLQASHVSVSKAGAPTRYLQLCIAKSKNDQCGKSATLRINSQSERASCPWRLARKFMRIRPQGASPFFVHREGAPVTTTQFNSVLKLCLEFARVPHLDRYSSHSFRIGGCSALAGKGVSEEALKQAGRWRSSAYKRYIRNSFTIPW